MAEIVANSVPTTTNRTTFLRDFKIREIITYGFAGFAAGVLTWLAKIGLDNWVMEPLFCRTPDTFSVCQNAGSISFVTALVLVGVLSVSFLYLAKTFRPLLVVLAAFTSIWGIITWLGPLDWWQAMLWCGVISLLAFTFYGLVAQIKRFAVPFATMLALIIVFQFFVKSI